MLAGLATGSSSPLRARRDFAESDALVGRKLACRRRGLRPIVCVGELLADRERHAEECRGQLTGALVGHDPRSSSPRHRHRLRAGLGDRHRPHGLRRGCRRHGRRDPRDAPQQRLGSRADAVPSSMAGPARARASASSWPSRHRRSPRRGASLKPDEMAGMVAGRPSPRQPVAPRPDSASGVDHAQPRPSAPRESTWNKENRFTGWTDSTCRRRASSRPRGGPVLREGRSARRRPHVRPEAGDRSSGSPRRARPDVVPRAQHMAPQRAALRRLQGLTRRDGGPVRRGAG